MQQGRGNTITLGQQIARMRVYWPAFVFQRQNGLLAWYGELRPRDEGATYRVRIASCERRPPRVVVLDPSLHPDALHRYGGGPLCLYYPEDGSWHPGLFIADTIVPWTAEWLFFYELWLESGRWWGPESPHGAVKHP